MDELKVCVDLSNAFEDKLFGLYNAYKERDENILTEDYKRIIGSDTLTEQLLIDAKKQSDFNKLFQQIKTVKTNFLNLHYVKVDCGKKVKN